MGVRDHVHRALTVALVPALVAHPLAGASVAMAWVASAWNPFLRRDRTDDRPRPRFEAWFLVPLVGAAITWLAHPTTPWTTIAGLAAVTTAALLVLGIRSALTSRHAALLGAGAAAAALALAVWATLDVALAGAARAQSATHHPNVTAGLAFGLAAAAWTVRRAGTRAASWLAIAGVAAGGLTFVWTGSRGAWIGVLFAAGAVLLVWVARHAARPRAAAVGVVVVAIAAVVALQWVVFEPGALGFARPDDALVLSGRTVDPGVGAAPGIRLRSLLDPWSASGTRVATWRVARTLAAAKPLFGYGFDAALPAFGVAAREGGMVVAAHPHNGALLMQLQGGTMLLVTVSFGLVGALAALARRAVTGDGIATGAFAATIALLAFDRFDLLLPSPAIGGLVVLTVLATLADRPPANDVPCEEPA